MIFIIIGIRIKNRILNSVFEYIRKNTEINKDESKYIEIVNQLFLFIYKSRFKVS